MAVDGGARCPVALSDRAVKVEFPTVRSILFWCRARVGANDGSVHTTISHSMSRDKVVCQDDPKGLVCTRHLLTIAGSPEKIGAAGLFLLPCGMANALPGMRIDWPLPSLWPMRVSYARARPAYRKHLGQSVKDRPGRHSTHAGPVEQNSRPATDKERGGWPGALLSSNVVPGESDVKRPLSQVSPGPIRWRYTSFLLGPVVRTGAAGFFVRSRARTWRCVARYADYPTTPMVLKPQVAMWEISYTDSESAAPRLPGLALLTCSQSGPAHPIVTPDGSFSMSRALFFLQVSLYLRALRKTCSPAHERKREPLVALVEG